MAAKNFEFGNHSDIGKVRQLNEDYMGYFNSSLNGDVFVVADGMGGHAGGSLAAQMAVASVREFLERHYFDDPADAIVNSLNYANAAIFSKAQSQPEYRGMGTTVVMLMLQGKKVWWGHVGDSRIYLQSFDGLRRITNDHSYVQKLVDDGLITEEEALTHPRRNELMAALGVGPELSVEIFDSGYEAIAGDMFLLCTDGLTNVVSDGEIEQIITQKAPAQQRAVQLVNLANQNGGPDNITVQLIELIATETAAPAPDLTKTQVVAPPQPDNKLTNPDLKTTLVTPPPVVKPTPAPHTMEDNEETPRTGGIRGLLSNKNVQFWGALALFLVVMGTFALQIADISFDDYRQVPLAAKDSLKTSNPIPDSLKPQTTGQQIISDNEVEKPIEEVKPEEQKPETTAPTGQEQIYTVKAGETVSGIANRLGTTKDVLIKLNNIKDNNIREGQELKYYKVDKPAAQPTESASATHVVESGELLYNIAKKYNTTQEKIIKANPSLKKAEDIKAGQKLVIPKE